MLKRSFEPVPMINSSDQRVAYTLHLLEFTVGGNRFRRIAQR